MEQVQHKPGGAFAIDLREVAVVHEDGVDTVSILSSGAEIGAPNFTDAARDLPGAIITTKSGNGEKIAFSPAHILAVVEQVDGNTLVYVRAGSRAFKVPLTVAQLKPHLRTG